MKMCFFAFHHVMTLPAPAFCPQNKQNNKKTQWKEICSFKQFSRSPFSKFRRSWQGPITCCSRSNTTLCAVGSIWSKLTGLGLGKLFTMCRASKIGASPSLRILEADQGETDSGAHSWVFAERSCCGEMERLCSTLCTISETYRGSTSWKEEIQNLFPF